MINFDDYTSEKNNRNWPHIPYKPCIILIIGCSGCVKTNVLLNLTENQPEIFKI